MASEELLSPRNDVSHYDGGAQREENVFVVWVENQSSVDLACLSKRSD